MISIAVILYYFYGELSGEATRSPNFILSSPIIWDQLLKESVCFSWSMVVHLTHEQEVPGSIPGLATYFRFSFRWFKKGSCQLQAKVCAWSTMMFTVDVKQQHNNNNNLLRRNSFL